ncbi:hypothetical protein Tco_0792501 [Tanacetum coccineum]
MRMLWKKLTCNMAGGYEIICKDKDVLRKTEVTIDSPQAKNGIILTRWTWVILTGSNISDDTLVSLPCMATTRDWVDNDDEETDLNFLEIQKKTVLNSENSETSFENRSPKSQDSVGQGSRKKGVGANGAEWNLRKGPIKTSHDLDFEKSQLCGGA